MSKEERLIAWFRDARAVAIGYSGGVDSVYLGAVAIEALGAHSVLGVTGRSASYPAAQWQAARDAAAAMGLTVLELDTNELEDPNYAANPSNRCYFCKSELWSVVVPAARERGIEMVVDGTNADDLHGHRPGAAAAREYGVRSPLAELGFTKAEIRAYSRDRGLPTSDQPSSPCLSSRIPTGVAVTAERLARIEAAEAGLRAAGIRGDLRVRHHDELARIELGEPELTQWLLGGDLAPLREAVLRAGYERAALDLGGFRSGSLSSAAGGRQGSGVALVPTSEPAAYARAETRRAAYAAAREEGFAFAALDLTSISATRQPRG